MEVHFFHVLLVAAASLNLNLIRNQLTHVYYVYDDFDERSVAEPMLSLTVPPMTIVFDDHKADIRNEAMTMLKIQQALASIDLSMNSTSLLCLDRSVSLLTSVSFALHAVHILL